MKIIYVIYCFPLPVVGWLTCFDEGWILYGRTCYKPVANITGENYEKAKFRCGGLKPGYLIVMPKTNEELEFVRNSFIYLKPFWIGLDFSLREKIWSWVDGSVVSDRSQFSEFLNTSRTGSARCVVMSTKSIGIGEFVGCKIKAGLVCQTEAYEIEDDGKLPSDECKETTTLIDKSSSFNIDDLKVVKTSLSSYVRSKISATDPRMSSKLLGCTGVLLISLAIGFIFALDAMPPNRIFWNSRPVRRLRKTCIRRMYSIRHRLQSNA